MFQPNFPSAPPPQLKDEGQHNVGRLLPFLLNETSDNYQTDGEAQS